MNLEIKRQKIITINIPLVHFGYPFLWGRGKWGVAGISAYLLSLSTGWAFNLINTVNRSSLERDARCHYFDHLHTILAYSGGYALVYPHGLIHN